MAVPPVQKITPLNWQVPIVNPDGTPSSQFIRLWQQLFGNGENSDDKVQQLIDAELQAGAGIAITPDGHLLSNPTISADLQAMLDALTDVQGSVLYRSGIDWTALGPGTSGQFLKTLGAGADPLWATPASGGGWTTLANIDLSISPAPTVEVNVTGYRNLFISVYNAVHAASVQRAIQCSIDGGATWYTTSGNYTDVAATGIPANNAALFLHTTATASARSGSCQILNNAGVIPVNVYIFTRSTLQQFTPTATAINRIRLMGSPAAGGTPSPSNFTSGSFFVQGQ